MLYWKSEAFTFFSSLMKTIITMSDSSCNPYQLSASGQCRESYDLGVCPGNVRQWNNSGQNNVQRHVNKIEVGCLSCSKSKEILDLEFVGSVTCCESDKQWSVMWTELSCGRRYVEWFGNHRERAGHQLWIL